MYIHIYLHISESLKVGIYDKNIAICAKIFHAYDYLFLHKRGIRIDSILFCDCKHYTIFQILHALLETSLAISNA